MPDATGVPTDAQDPGPEQEELNDKEVARDILKHRHWGQALLLEEVFFYGFEQACAYKARQYAERLAQAERGAEFIRHIASIRDEFPLTTIGTEMCLRSLTGAACAMYPPEVPDGPQ